MLDAAHNPVSALPTAARPRPARHPRAEPTQDDRRCRRRDRLTVPPRSAPDGADNQPRGGRSDQPVARDDSLRLEGAIIATALYTGELSRPEALAAAAG